MLKVSREGGVRGRGVWLLGIFAGGSGELCRKYTLVSTF